MDQHADQARRPVVGRRNLVRVGVTSAWTVPLLLHAVPAQAAACSAGFAVLSATESDVSKALPNAANDYVVHLTLKVSNSGSTTTGLKVDAFSRNAVEGVLGMSYLSVGDWPAFDSAPAINVTVTAPADKQLASGTVDQEYAVTFKLPGAYWIPQNTRIIVSSDCGNSVQVTISHFPGVPPV